MITAEIKNKYEAVIGLEVHAQMLTLSKAYSSDANRYGERPNTLVSPATLGHPGTLPRMNKKTVEYAIKLGIALNCKITDYQFFDRKCYFYPDLPKGFQITQDKFPICTNGFVELKLSDNTISKVRINRIHMEEDTGKSIHDLDLYDTLLDLNRAGTPLLEIVTDPDMRTGEEAYEYLKEIRHLVRYLDICDGNMEEGNLRCDANISVRLKGAKEFGRRVEVKNMNSMHNVRRAIEYETNRHIELVEKGEQVVEETRTFDALNDRTLSMREKSEETDYRYIPEPDLLPLFVSQGQVEAIKAEMPTLPKVLFKRYTEELKLSEYDATIIISSKAFAEFFEEVISKTKNYKSAANWVIGVVRSYLNKNGITIAEFHVPATQIADLIIQIDKGLISNSIAEQKIFPVMLEKPNVPPTKIAEELNVIQDRDEGSLRNVILDVLKQHSEEVERYKNGEKQLVGFFMGNVMKASGGKADPKSTNQLIRKILDKK